MAYGDPFDAAGADLPPQQAGGVSPDFWRNLAMFGSQMSVAANARTPQGFLAYGNGFAGPFGAGIQGGMQNSMDVAKLRSNLGLQQAQTQDVRSQAASRNIQNKLGLYNLNLTSQLYGGPQFDEQGNVLPQGQSSPYSVLPQGQPQSSAAPAEGTGPQIAGSPYARGIATMESNGKPDAQNPNWSVTNGGPLGPHQFTADTWNAFRQENPQYFANMTPEQAMAARTDPNLSATATDWLAQKNAGVLQQAGIPATPQNLGIAHVLGGAGAASVLKFPDQAPLSQVFQVTQPNAAQQILTQNPQYAKMTVGDLKRKYSGLSAPGDGRVQYAQAGNVATDASTAPGPQQRVQVAQAGNGPIPLSGAPTQQPQQSAPQPTMNPLGIAQGILTGRLQNPTPQQALAAAPLIGRINPQLGQELMHYGLAGPQATAESNAKNQSDLSYAGPIAQQKAINSNFALRPGSMGWVQTPNGPQWMKVPELKTVQSATGETNYVHITPPMPGSPDNTPGTATTVLGDNGKPAVEAIPKQVQEGLDKSYDEFNGKGADSYVAAKNTQGWLEQMDHAAETLNQAGGFLSTGPTAPERIAFANNVNDVLRTMGLPTAFDPKAVGAWEELKKATTTAGFELSSHYEGHARQAAATIENATSAVPSAANSPIGYYTVSSGIREAAQSAADMREFAQAPVAKKGGDINQAAIDFYKTITPQMYARRAISNVTPYPVKSDTELSRYLPGTFIQYKGNVVQVPERPGAPPIPDYLKNAHPMVPTQ